MDFQEYRDNVMGDIKIIYVQRCVKGSRCSQVVLANVI